MEPTADQARSDYSESEQCPITEIRVETLDTVSRFQDDGYYKVSQFSDGQYFLVTSKTKTDSLPILNVHLL